MLAQNTTTQMQFIIFIFLDILNLVIEWFSILHRCSGSEYGKSTSIKNHYELPPISFIFHNDDQPASFRVHDVGLKQSGDPGMLTGSQQQFLQPHCCSEIMPPQSVRP